VLHREPREDWADKASYGLVCRLRNSFARQWFTFVIPAKAEIQVFFEFSWLPAATRTRPLCSNDTELVLTNLRDAILVGQRVRRINKSRAGERVTARTSGVAAQIGEPVRGKDALHGHRQLFSVGTIALRNESGLQGKETA
jgi:hypothetical protein